MQNKLIFQCEACRQEVEDVRLLELNYDKFNVCEDCRNWIIETIWKK